jgi:two-component system, NtrC family, sensor histidine kinase HydH
MTLHEKLGLVACVGHLALAILLLIRRAKSTIALPLALLCLDLFVWNFASLAWDVTGNSAWRRLDTAVSWLTPPLGLHLVTAFVGRSRALRPMLVGFYLFFAQLPFWADTPGWDLVFLAGVVPAVAVAVVLLAIHLQKTVEREETIRSRYMLAAMSVGGVLGSSDLWYDHVGLPMSVANIATFASTSLVAVAALRVKLVWQKSPSWFGLLALALAALGLAGYLTVVRTLGTEKAMAVVAVTIALSALYAVVREGVGTREVEKERAERLATLGRFSQQMAHDLKNPLAALKGALQFLKEEERQGRSLATHAEFLDLMLEQVARLQRVIGDYQRMAKVEPVRARVNLNDVVRDVLALQPFAANETTRVDVDLAASLPTCELDRDLVARAIENLVQNAFEAMPSGGTVRVRTARDASSKGVVLSIEDSGTGMDVRQVEQAFDEFFTTKAQGSGLGLSLVRRVVDAHGGRVGLTSEIGRGTSVRIELPASESQEENETR